MIKNCAHIGQMEYIQDKAGIIDWLCLDCGEVVEQFQDATCGR